MSQEDMEPLLKNMASHLKRLIDERDEHSEVSFFIVLWKFAFLKEKMFSRMDILCFRGR